MGGRLAADGVELEPIDLDELPVLDGAVGSVAVCLLHGDLDAAHEQAVAVRLCQQGHDVCCSHEVSPENREYERTSTTGVNAYMPPVCGSYLRGLDGAAGEVLVLTSAGGLVPAGEAAEVPASLLLSARPAACGRQLQWRWRVAGPMPSPSTWAAPAPTFASSEVGPRSRHPSGRRPASRCGCRRSTSTPWAPVAALWPASMPEGCWS